jgi:DNA-binding response OmpR family regulator
MKLEMLLVTNDREVVNAVRPGLERLGIAVQLRAEPLSATEVCDRRRFDGLIIDMEVGPQSRELLARVRRGRANRLSSILAVSGGTMDPKQALTMGANFSLQKPLCPDTFDQYLKLALAVMVREISPLFPVSRATSGHDRHR